MQDEPARTPATEAWKNQPGEDIAMNMPHLLDRRAQSLFASTRAEIVTSIAAALLFLAVIVWRFAPALGAPELLCGAGIVLWAAATLYRFRGRLFPAPADLAEPGLAYYRRELARRRDHLRSAWIWHGPLVLAALLFVVRFTGPGRPTPRALRGIAPLILLLLVWTAAGIWRRTRQAAALEHELDELNHSTSGSQ